MSYTRRVNAARLFSGTTSPYNDPSSAVRGVHAQHPASYPKFSLDNSVNGTIETGLRLYLPAPELLRTNPKDKDILKPLINNRYIQLIVTSVQEQFAERVQVHEVVNGAFVTYYYGIRPPTITLSGHVLNDAIDDWRNQLLRLYMQYLRGSRLSKIGKLVTVSHSDMVISGEATSLGSGLTGQGETHGSFTLSLIVHRVTVRRSPIFSDFTTREQAPLVNQVTPTVTSKRKKQGVIRSSSSGDVVTQGTEPASVVRNKIQALESQKSELNASLVNAKTRLTVSQQILDSHKQQNSDNPFDSFGLTLEASVNAAQADVTAIQRQIAEVSQQQKQLREGTALRDKSTQRPRQAKTATPDRVISIGGKTRPPINRKLTQGVA